MEGKQCSPNKNKKVGDSLGVKYSSSPWGEELCYSTSTSLFGSLFPPHIAGGKPPDNESDLDSYKYCGGVKLQVLQANRQKGGKWIKDREAHIRKCRRW